METALNGAEVVEVRNALDQAKLDGENDVTIEAEVLRKLFNFYQVKFGKNA